MISTVKKPSFPYNKGSGSGFAVAGMLAMLAITAATSMYPTFSIRNDAISTLGGAGVPTEFFWNSVLIIVGLLWIWSTTHLFRKSGRKIMPVFFYLAAIGFILVGSSPWDQFPTTHYFGAQLAFLFGSISCISGSRITKGAISTISIISGLLSLGVYFTGYIGLGNLFGSGGVERLIYYPIILWSIAFGGYLLNAGKSAE